MLNAKLADAPNVAPRPTLIKSSGRGQKPLSELLVDGLVTITPELAHRIIQTGKFERQRPVRGKHVDALAAQMRRREWTLGTQIHFGRTPDGELHLVNGQHRMHAIIKADAAIQFQVLVTDVATEKELIRLYRRHDRLVAARTVTDALAAEGIMQQHGLRNEIANGIFSAVLLLDSGFRSVRRYADAYATRSDEQRLRLAEEWWSFGVTFQELIEAAPANPMKRYLKGSGTMAAALATVRYQPEIADIFWRGLAENDGLARNDPRAAYIRYIYTNKSKSELEAAKAAAAAWNAAYDGRTLEGIRIGDGQVLILGTPFAKPRK